MNLLKRHTLFIHCSAIILLGALVYANTLNGVFQFDDKLNIVDNPLIRTPDALWPPSGARWFGTLTFSLNYLAGGLNPYGYHLANIAIHILMALSVYCFIHLTFRTPFFRGRNIGTIDTAGFAWACALLFVAHPIQTQAVTYVVQRFASLAALLYLLSFNCYITARLQWSTTDSEILKRRFSTSLLFLASALFALLGMKTKENTFTLPVMFLVYDLMFLANLSHIRAYLQKRWRAVASLAAALSALAAVAAIRFDLAAVLSSLRATNEISRHDYLITQFRVIVTYLRLLLLPTGLSVDHHYPVYRSLANPEVAASLILLVLLMSAAVLLCRLSVKGDGRLRLIAFGIFWFFITLSIESGLIPIVDVMFEHRLYLPSVGAILAISTTGICLLDRVRISDFQKRIAAAAVLVTLVTTLGVAAYLRNRVWQSELTLWNDVIEKTPRNPRGYNMVGNYYRHSLRLLDAITYYRRALDVDPGYAEARSNLGSTYVQLGMIDEGLNELMITLRNNRFDAIDTGILYYNIGKGFYNKGMIDQSAAYLNRALQYIPNEEAVQQLLADINRQQGKVLPTR